MTRTRTPTLEHRYSGCVETADEDNEDLFKIKFDQNEQGEEEASSKMKDSEEEGDDEEDERIGTFRT